MTVFPIPRFCLPERALPTGALAVLVAIGITACGGGGDGDGGSASAPPPTVSLSVSPASIVQGQTASLSWTASDSSSCSASGGWSGTQAVSGSSAVTPTTTGTLTYTLTCTGGGAYAGDTVQSATLTVTAASAFTQTRLVGNLAGSGAATTDANLVNGWGIAFGTTSPVWVANNGSTTSTLYNGNGKAQPVAAPRVVGLDAGFAPTGVVFNGSTGFVVSAAGKSAAAAFIFSGESGRIAGWASSVDAAKAITVYTDGGGAVYKGLAVASNGGASYLYATDFRNGKVDVFDSSYAKQAPTPSRFAFTDPTLPAGYAPFGIQAIGSAGAQQIIVAYALKASAAVTDESIGAGLGLVDVFDANGSFVKRLVEPGGKLNAPWGVALAPSDFGTLSGALLVANFGDGKINGFDATSGRFLGTVKDDTGTDINAPGLWGIAFGNDAGNQPHNTLFYAAGPAGETAGAYGRIDLGSTPPALNQLPVVTLTVPGGTLAGAVTLSASVQSPLNVSRVEFFVNGSSVGIDTTSPFSLSWDSTGVSNGTVTVSARATDSDGNVGNSADTMATVSNGVAAPTLTELQLEVFSACTGCHNGSAAPGGALPGSMNLNAGFTYASIVDVASRQQPGLMRVKPGDPAASYLVRKLEGTPGISGARMPFGGPYFDATTIDRVKAWIAAGAPDN